MKSDALVIQKTESSLAHIGETAAALERLTFKIRDLLGDRFNPTMPTTEEDAAIILDWLRSGKKASSRNTMREYLRDLCGSQTGFLMFVEQKPLSKISRQNVQDYAETIKSAVIPATGRRAEHSLSVSTQRRMLASIKGLLTHANAMGYTAFNPGRGVSLPILPESRRDKAMSQKQSIKMLVTAQRLAEETTTKKRRALLQRNHLLNRICYLTGGRISEVLNLRWINTYSTDKGAEIKFEHAKGQKERVLSLPDDLFDDLQSMRSEYRAQDNDFVFPSQKGGKLSISQGWRIVTALAQSANIGRKVSPHTWRHSIATQLLDKGAPLHQVSEFLGHSDPKITVKSYYSASTTLKVTDYLGE